MENFLTHNFASSLISATAIISLTIITARTTGACKTNHSSRRIFFLEEELHLGKQCGQKFEERGINEQGCYHRVTFKDGFEAMNHSSYSTPRAHFLNVL